MPVLKHILLYEEPKRECLSTLAWLQNKQKHP